MLISELKCAAPSATYNGVSMTCAVKPAYIVWETREAWCPEHYQELGRPR